MKAAAINKGYSKQMPALFKHVFEYNKAEGHTDTNTQHPPSRLNKVKWRL